MVDNIPTVIVFPVMTDTLETPSQHAGPAPTRAKIDGVVYVFEDAEKAARAVAMWNAFFDLVDQMRNAAHQMKILDARRQFHVIADDKNSQGHAASDFSMK